MNRKYRKTIIAGNWKMNKTAAEGKALIEEIKTKAFQSFLTKLGVEKKALVITENVDEKVVKSARNIEGVTTTIATILSPYMVLTNGKLVVDKAALAKIEEVYA